MNARLPYITLFIAMAAAILVGLPAKEAVSLPVDTSGDFSVDLNETEDVYDDAEDHLAVLIEVTAGTVEVQYREGATGHVLAAVDADQGCGFEGEWGRVRVKGVTEGQSTGSYAVRDFTGSGSALGSFAVELGSSATRVYYSTMAETRRCLVIEADENNSGDVDVALSSTGSALQSAEPGDSCDLERSATEFWLSGESAHAI